MVESGVRGWGRGYQAQLCVGFQGSRQHHQSYRQNKSRYTTSTPQYYYHDPLYLFLTMIHSPLSNQYFSLLVFITPATPTIIIIPNFLPFSLTSQIPAGTLATSFLDRWSAVVCSRAPQNAIQWAISMII